MDKKYNITSFNFGSKYEPVKDTWFKRVNDKCGSHSCITIILSDILKKLNFNLTQEYAWWDVVRLDYILKQMKDNKPIVHIDQDVILEKDIQPLIELPYDIIISTEIGNENAFPPECSKILGFGVCSGFYILKSSSLEFMKKILNNMKTKKYGSYSDQVNIMNYIVNNNYEVNEEAIILDTKKYTNKIITIDNIKICVLDFNIVIRDPIINDGQFANHINIDNVGGVHNFLRYFNEDLQTLPLTCRCGKRHLGDSNICKHILLRNQGTNVT
jgi:hypothetical protein